MHGNFTRENREVPSTPDTQLCAGRLEKDMIQKSNMYVDGKSDGRAVPTKCLNKSGNPLTEGMEGRRPAEENTERTTEGGVRSTDVPTATAAMLKNGAVGRDFRRGGYEKRDSQSSEPRTP